MRFADELRGSEGERCTVKGIAGTIEGLTADGQYAYVRLDNGIRPLVSYRDVELEGEEAP